MRLYLLKACSFKQTGKRESANSIKIKYLRRSPLESYMDLDARKLTPCESNI
jgi:hypothetical protein